MNTISAGIEIKFFLENKHRMCAKKVSRFILGLVIGSKIKRIFFLLKSTYKTKIKK